MLTPRANRTIKYIVVHHSATNPDHPVDAAEIHAWHTERGFDGIGYNYVVCVDGIVEQGRPEYWIGSHAAPHNTASIGVCIVGTGYPSTYAQRHSASLLLRKLLKRYPDAKLVGHSDLSNTKCPGFDVHVLLEETTDDREHH